MVQFAPAARLVPQLYPNTNEEAFAPVTEIPVMDSAAEPVLVRVTDCDPLVAPTFTEPNDRLEADKDVAGAELIPLSWMLWVAKPGEPAFSELSVITSASLMGLPAETGASSILSLELPPAVREKNFLQSSGVPLPVTCLKSAGTVTPDAA